jgi:hypothetical protein
MSDTMRVITIPPTQLPDGDTEMEIRYAVADLLELGGREIVLRKIRNMEVVHTEDLWLEVSDGQ